MTQAEADRYAARCREALETSRPTPPGWPPRPVLEHDSVGPLPRVNVSVKVSALTPLMRPEAPEVGRDDAARRLRPLLRLARDLGAHLHIDMESLDTLETTHGARLRAARRAGVPRRALGRARAPGLPARVARASSIASSTGRARRARTPPLVDPAREGRVLGPRGGGGAPARLDAAGVRGEGGLRPQLRAAHAGASSTARPVVRLAIASHNLRSVAHAIAYKPRRRGRGPRPRAAGAARARRRARARRSPRTACGCASYCPVGDLVAGMAYLVRRLLENTSNESFLQNWRGRALEELLAAP